MLLFPLSFSLLDQIVSGYYKIEIGNDISEQLRNKKNATNYEHDPEMMHIWGPFTLPACTKFERIYQLVVTEINYQYEKENTKYIGDQIKNPLCLR
jgi:hypothetical protein